MLQGMLFPLHPTMIKTRYVRKPAVSWEAGGLLDWMAGRLHLSEKSSLPKHCPPPDSTLLFFCEGGNSLQFPRCQPALSYHSLAIQLWLAWNRGSDVEPGDRHLITLLYAANRRGLAGWSKREANTASLIQTSALLCTPRGRCFTPIHTLINFLTRHSSSFPAVTSSALCPVAQLLSNGEMSDIKMICRGAKGERAWTPSPPWPGFDPAWRQLSCQPECSLTWQCLSVSTPTLESFFPCCTGPHSRPGIWLTYIAGGYAWGAGVPSL